jgi:hypothetical protein
LVKAQINDRQWLITDEEEHPHKRTSENLIYLGKTNMVSPSRMLEGICFTTCWQHPLTIGDSVRDILVLTLSTSAATSNFCVSTISQAVYKT